MFQRARVAWLFRSANPAHRARAVELIGPRSGTFTRMLLKQALVDIDPRVRTYAADAIVTRGWVSILVEALAHQRSAVRVEAADALGDLGNSAALPGLIRTLQDPVVTVRATAAYALGEIGAVAALPVLVAMMQDPTPAARRVAVYALGNLGDVRAIAAVRAARTDHAPEVREAAEAAERKLAGRRRRW